MITMADSAWEERESVKTTVKTRKRKRYPEKWKRNILKKKKSLGQAYERNGMEAEYYPEKRDNLAVVIEDVSHSLLPMKNVKYLKILTNLETKTCRITIWSC